MPMPLDKPIRRSRHAILGLTVAVSLSGAISAHAVRGTAKPAPKKTSARKPVAKALTGEQVYSQRCASCHGAKGEGTKSYAKALAGTQSVGQLARFIHESMPPGAKPKLATADAQKVSAYIFDAFYSPLAQERNRPARVELSRLTVRQYRNAVADLIGSFRRTVQLDQRQGLRGEYFKGRRAGSGRDRTGERLDPEIRFDFGQGTPTPEQTDPYQFSMRWEGGIVAPETGEYEFTVRSEQATRLWINDLNTPLVDAYVQSGTDTEHRGTIFLLGGRVYPLRLDFSKSTQGVDNPEKLKQKPPAKASLSLEWKRPHQANEVVPRHCLVPVSPAEAYVLATPFPPDDRSMGYERGSSISKEWDAATTEAAFDTAGYVATRLRELAGAQDGAPDRAAKLQEFCRQFATRAFRRPLTPEQEQLFVQKQFQSASDPEIAVKRSVLLVLKSPRFLYREFGTTGAAGTGTPDPYDVASRLSFGLWDSLPDNELLKAAAAGQLATRQQVAAQAERMLADGRTRSKLRELLLQWLKVDHYPDLAKDGKLFAGFDAAVATDLRTSLELTLDHMVWGERSDFRDLLLSDKVFLNGRLAKIYGVELPADAPFQPVSLEPGQRSGVLTHPYLLASFAYLDTTSPIHRGVLIARNMLGRTLQPPPQAFTPLPAEAHPNLTTRQRVILQTKPEACASCHDMINPLGFTLEKFDAIGRLRALENGKPIDATGLYRARDGRTVKFAGVRDLTGFLAESPETHAAFVEKLFQNMVKQPVRAFGPQALPDLQRTFASSGFNVRKQLVETVTVAALGRSTPAASQAQLSLLIRL